MSSRFSGIRLSSLASTTNPWSQRPGILEFLFHKILKFLSWFLNVLKFLRRFYDLLKFLSWFHDVLKFMILFYDILKFLCQFHNIL